jgi:adenylate kinase
VADYYKSKNKLVEVKGEGTVETIFDSLCDEIDTIQPE